MEGYGNKLKSKILEIEYSHKKIGILSALLNAIREPIIILIMVLVILVEIEIMGGSLSLIILSLLFFYRALTFLMSVQGYWNSLLANHGSLENMKEFIQELKLGRETQGSHKVDTFKQFIQFEDVSFNYGDSKILHNISFILPKNQVLLVSQTRNNLYTRV